MNNFLAAIKMALVSMRANKGRTALTVLGIVIGIASIIVVYSAGAGIRGLLVSEVESFGTNIIQSEIKVPTGKSGAAGDNQSAMAMAQGIQVTTMTLSDMADINKLDNVSRSYGAILSQEQASYGSEKRKAFLFGTSASYLDIDTGKISQGRFFSDDEDQSLAAVAVLGSQMKDKLFGDSDALGQYVSIHKKKFKVVGVMASKGAGMGMNFDDYIYLPVRTLQKKIMGIDHLMYMVHQVKDTGISADTAEEIRTILRQNHHISDPAKDDFRISTMDDMMKILDTVTGALTILLLAIVIISLIVGGVGILNVMYVVVGERTMEIGLRKAVGANRKDILVQFLVESVIITLFGGIIGVLFGVFISFLISVGAQYANLDWQFVIPIKSLVVAFIFSLVFGVGFGVYPARKAARLDPIEALRKE